MRIVVQRAKKAKVIVNHQVVGAIDYGLMILVGVTHDDGEEDLQFMADKIVNLRIFEDEEGKMNLSLLDIKGSVLSVSQFTLYGDARKGRRPNFMNAAKPEIARKVYERLNELIREKGVHVETGVFGEMMDVEFTNDGPVTILLET
ncbi:D-aminoacyl-tRNA deacylase [Tepidibacillus infernus]|uniref:D-aminoacyl-tRNA deacylase n=1 Tax=Tepidibacillus decaturensis TaxID=1413211 RepID=A0A135L273_9BACI|nr:MULTISPECIES: D-aminoacyl-tRNA deacylase [Tepidibacillus]KXG43114.1 D-tyrosyl-tRNA(Tyr) deacylase [Tepidibacillus decaturensis]GBF10054.1 D-tyrosyl-tRNA(Tyr) deacylase [Tepidibacillus sp. HK-1]